jgi:hypothetical protein
MFSKPAPNQVAVLAAFEEECWEFVIDDPLPFRRGRNPVKRLCDTVHSLNRRLITGRIRFFAARQGRAIRWEFIIPDSPEI